MKKPLILCFLLAMFASVGSALADEGGSATDEQEQGTVDEGGSHKGDAAQ